MPRTAYEDAAWTDEGAPRVLVVEQDEKSGQQLQASLAEAGFAVTAVDGEEEALAALARRCRPHLVMLDWEHPRVAAHTFIAHVQRHSPDKQTRLIVLSTRSTEQEIVAALELGVDDYVVRPYSLPLLMARIRAVLRAGHRVAGNPTILEYHDLRLDVSDCRLMIGREVVMLRAREQRLMEFFMRHPERVFSRSQVLLAVSWPRSARASLRLVDVTVQRVRKSLAHYGRGNYLQTVRAVGYRLSVRA